MLNISRHPLEICAGLSQFRTVYRPCILSTRPRTYMIPEPYPETRKLSSNPEQPQHAGLDVYNRKASLHLGLVASNQALLQR